MAIDLTEVCDCIAAQTTDLCTCISDQTTTLAAQLSALQLKSGVEITSECLWDVDTTDPAAPAITPFARLTAVCVEQAAAGDPLTVTHQPLGDFVDGAEYTPVGDVMAPGELGQQPTGIAPGSRTITGPATFTPSADQTYLLSLTAAAFGVDPAVPAAPVTVTDAFGNISKLRDTQTRTWTADLSLPLTPPTFNIPSDTELDVHWTEPTI